MAIPDYQTLMLPVLQMFSDNKEKSALCALKWRF
jgi:restriction endonuclease Mrr